MLVPVTSAASSAPSTAETEGYVIDRDPRYGGKTATSASTPTHTEGDALARQVDFARKSLFGGEVASPAAAEEKVTSSSTTGKQKLSVPAKVTLRKYICQVGDHPMLNLSDEKRVQGQARDAAAASFGAQIMGLQGMLGAIDGLNTVVKKDQGSIPDEDLGAIIKVGAMMHRLYGNEDRAIGVRMLMRAICSPAFEKISVLVGDQQLTGIDALPHFTSKVVGKSVRAAHKKRREQLDASKSGVEGDEDDLDFQ
jgi:hypothetical protein